MKLLKLHSAAQAELDRAADYYEQQRPGLAREFIDEVQRTFRHVQRFPRSGSAFGLTEYRKCVVQRFPYLIFFRELEDTIWIVAVAHAKRKPGYWRRRKISGDN